jgi:hypothetical protein
MKYLIISTYPKSGSQNVGDKLIETSTIAAFTSQEKDAEFRVVWREEKSDQVEPSLEWCDAVVFACFAIRPKMNKIYPLIDILLKSQKPIIVISAGTSLNITSRSGVKSEFNSQSLETLRKIEKQCILFSTRGRLSQFFCEINDLKKSVYTGDVAFFDKRFNLRKFERKKIERNIVSDPHREDLYFNHTELLINGLHERFPNADIAFAIHGNNSPGFIQIAKKHSLVVHECFKDPEVGLDVYDTCDLHVGFRVHGHVSALKRRKYSYLLEQDGRGVDYGLSLSPKISVPAFSVTAAPSRVRRLFRHLPFITTKVNPYVPASSVAQILSLLDRDIATEFSSFMNLEAEIVEICDCISKEISLALDTLNR